MSWLFSRVLVAEYLGESSLDGEQSSPSNGSHIPQAYCAPDKMTDFCRLSRFGMTFKPLTEDRGEELLTLYRAGFHAKTFQLQEKAQELKEIEAECGDTWRGSLARFDPASSSWKTVQPSLLGDSDESSVTWPRSGMTADGQCWELPMLERRTREIDCGSLQKWPTPQASDNRNRGTTKTPAIARRIEKGKQVMLSMCMDGPLNPMWVEWLMGWPLGWTDLKPLETGKSHCVPLELGNSLVGLCDGAVQTT